MTTLVFAILLAAPLTGGVLAVPPEATPPAADNAWIGEAVSDLLPRALAVAGVAAVDREDRLRAQEALEIPPVPLTHATSIRVAEALESPRVVLGTYTVNGPRLSLALKVVDVERGTLSAPFVVSGALADLSGLVYSLAWDVAASGPSPPALPRADLVARRPEVSAEGMSAYGQALLARNATNKLRYARRAVTLAPSFHPARLLLGRLLMEGSQFSLGEEMLARIPSSAPEARAARFLQGVAMLEVGRYREGASLYAAMGVEAPTAGVLNNQALGALRGLKDGSASALLRQAVQIRPDSTDVVFNLAWALLSEGQADAAAYYLRDLIRREPLDSHARLLLAWAEKKAGRTKEAEEAWKGVLSLAPSYGALTSPDFSRRFERILPAERFLNLARGERTEKEVAAGLVGRAEKLKAKGDLEGAVRELTRAAYLDPDSARVHLLLARAYRQRGAREQAVAEYKMTLWAQDDAAVRAEMAALLAEMGRKQEAKAEAEKALKLDPANAAARKLIGK